VKLQINLYLSVVRRSFDIVIDCHQTVFTAARVVDSSCRNALSFSSAWTIKRLPSLRCASTIQIVRP
jgi:hypothetical protein